MKSIFFYLTIANYLLFSSVLLLGEQQSATAKPNSPLTPSQAQQLSRDLIPSQSQEFFRQGQVRIEREIQILTQRSLFFRGNFLQINIDPKGELDRLPQLSNDFFKPKPTKPQ